MKKLIASLLVLATVFTLFSLFPASHAQAKDDLPEISWFVTGMTVGSAREISPAILELKRDSKTLDASEAIASGDTVVTANGEYVAWVLGDVAEKGKADAYSYILIKRFCLKTYDLNEQELFCADINKDGNINSYDYILEKRICLKTYTLKTPENSKGVPILLYHHMLTDADKNTDQWRNNDITIATSEFRRHMKMLKDNGYNVATVEEVVAYVRGEILLPKKSIVLCFDDGYKSNTYYAAPILREFGYKATVFSIMSLFDGQYQDWYDVSSLQHITRKDLASFSDVLDQQCHTWANHNHLSQQSYNQVYNDLMQSQNCEKYKYFAYPYGDYDAEVIKAVKAAGFLAAVTTEERNAVPGDKIYEIPRYTVTSPMSDSDYLKLIGKAG
jgi:peptidoglycan/xylan/chitin deacetylase (PgdA/CDA1 family)